MRYAINLQGEKVEVSYSKQKALCPDCKSDVYGRDGRVRPKYWRHGNNPDCDKWHEPITKWHIDWQDEFEKQYQEIQLIEDSTGEVHRADIMLPNGTVIEVQNSPIAIDEIESREAFYGKKHMIWILNGANLIKQSNIKYHFLPKTHELSITIADYLNELPSYDLDEYRNMIYSTDEYKSIQNFDSDAQIDIQNGSYILFKFRRMDPIHGLIDDLDDIFRNIFTKRYGYNNIELYRKHFSVSYTNRPLNTYESPKLTKKYWRRFIDFLKYPVFIDNLNGLQDGNIYHLQANRILTRQSLIEKVQKEKNWPILR